MNEKYLPTKDIKTGFRVVNAVGRGIYKETEPLLKVYLSSKCVEFIDNINFRKKS